MCSIFGMITNGTQAQDVMGQRTYDMLTGAIHRGRDGMGVHVAAAGSISSISQTVAKAGTEAHANYMESVVQRTSLTREFTMIGNARAEPTTEWVKKKEPKDQQPYRANGWTIVHNGTIANDKGLRLHTLKHHQVDTTIDSAAIVEWLASNTLADSWGKFDTLYNTFVSCIKGLKGSYAILAMHESMPGYIFTACNYRPIWMVKDATGVYLGSERAMLPASGVPEMLEAYTCNVVSCFGWSYKRFLIETTGLKALVVASGGMDSTVAAAICQSNALDVTLINFQYGCRAEGKELQAIKLIAEDLKVPLVLFPIPIYDPKDSPLFDHNAEIAGGEAGAEFAHEWVPARNLVMLSVATAYAEANGFSYIVLGNNLEEAGAYPDNEPEFINRFNEVLPFAVGDGKRVRVLMPVGNFMKHEIVALGLEHGAPLQHTWSCYRNGELHCGTCGPCMMRRTAFNINGKQEVIKYLTDL